MINKYHQLTHEERYSITALLRHGWTQAALPMEPQCSQQRMLQQKLNRVLEFGKKRLRKSGASPLLVVLRRFSKVLFRLRVKQIPHWNSALNRARVSGPERNDTTPLSISA